jgi:hypothetical protein
MFDFIWPGSASSRVVHSHNADALARWDNEGGAIMTFQFQADGSASNGNAKKCDGEPELLKIDASLSEEDLILECLGAAVIMRWDSLAVDDQREMLKQAFPLAGLAKTGQLKNHIARFLHDRTLKPGQFQAHGLKGLG